MTEAQPELPIADIEPHPITIDEYFAFTPEKLELWSGYLLQPREEMESRRWLLALLLVNCGLAEAVSLAPQERWRVALERAYPNRGE